MQFGADIVIDACARGNVAQVGDPIAVAVSAADDEIADDLPFTSSGVVDVNNIAEIPDATTVGAT